MVAIASEEVGAVIAVPPSGVARVHWYKKAERYSLKKTHSKCRSFQSVGDNFIDVYSENGYVVAVQDPRIVHNPLGT